MSHNGDYRFARQNSQADKLNDDGDSALSTSTTVRKTRQQRYSIVYAEKSPSSDFTQTPFGNDDMFNACFDDCEGEEEDPRSRREKRLTSTFANSTRNWTSNRKISWDMPTMNGKLVKHEVVETGFRDYDPYPSVLPRRHSEFSIDRSRLTRSTQAELFSKNKSYSTSQKYAKWSYNYDTEFTNLSDIYPTRYGLQFVVLQ